MAPDPLIRLRALLPIVTLGWAWSASVATPVCLSEIVAAPDLRELVAEAVDVLAACGHQPEAYAVELRLDDPVTLAGTERRPEVTVVFEPLDDGRHYPLGVSRSDPCVVSWIWLPDRFTDWQNRVLERVRSRARETGAAWVGRSTRLELRVTESQEYVGVRLWSPDAPGPPELRVVLAKHDLSVVETSSGED